MRFRLGMMVGFGAGYVMGAKAGRARYDVIRQSMNQVLRSEQVHQLQERATKVVDQVKELANERKVKLDPEPEMAAPQEPFATAAGAGVPSSESADRL